MKLATRIRAARTALAGGPPSIRDSVLRQLGPLARARVAAGILTAREPARAIYEATRYSPRRGYLPGAVQSVRFDLSKATRYELQRKSRYWQKNSPLYNTIGGIFETYTVGRGLVVMPDSDDPEWNKYTFDKFQLWGEACDLTSSQGMGTLQSLAASNWFFDGESMIHKTRGPSLNGKYQEPRLQLFEAQDIETPDEFRNDRNVFDGIRFDPNGRAVGYYVRKEDNQGYATGYDYVVASNIEHVFEPERPRQARGIPFVTPALNELQDLHEISILEMTAAKRAAAVQNVIKKIGGEVDSEELRRELMARTMELADDGTAVVVDRQEYFDDVTDGENIVLDQGEEFDQFRSERPSVVTQAYLDRLEARVAMATQVPYVLAKPESMQGTVFRGALDVATANFRQRSLVIEKALRGIWRFWVLWERFVDSRVADLPGNWQRVKIIPPRAVNVDVGRNASATKIELELGLTTYDIEYGARGYHWEERFEALAKQIAKARDLGIPISFLNAAAAGQSPAQPSNQPATANA